MLTRFIAQSEAPRNRRLRDGCVMSLSILAFTLALTTVPSSTIGQRRRNSNRLRPNQNFSLQEQAAQQANAFWNSRITKCGSDYYTQSPPYVFQIRNPRIELEHGSLTPAARLNGVEYLGFTGYGVGQSRRYSSKRTLWDDGGWSAWRDGFADIAGTGLRAEIRKAHGQWTVTPIWGTEAGHLRSISCKDGANPQQYFSRLGSEALAAADAEMMRAAPDWGIYLSKEPTIHIDAFRSLYLQTKNYEQPRLSLGPGGRWLISYGSTGVQVGPLPQSIRERTKQTDWPAWIAFSPNGGWFYNTSVIAYENIPSTLITFLKQFSQQTKAGTSLISDIHIISLSFGPQDSWVLIYDDDQTRFPRAWHQEYPTIRRYACNCSKDIQEIVQGNIDNGREVKQFLYVSRQGWLLLRDAKGFVTENVPTDLERALTEAQKKWPTISGVAVAPNGAWVVMARKF